MRKVNQQMKLRLFDFIVFFDILRIKILFVIVPIFRYVCQCIYFSMGLFVHVSVCLCYICSLFQLYYCPYVCLSMCTFLIRLFLYHFRQLECTKLFSSKIFFFVVGFFVLKAVLTSPRHRLFLTLTGFSPLTQKIKQKKF